MFNNRLPINKAGAVTPEKAKSRCTPRKDDATARLKLGSIVRKAARVVAYCLASLVLVAAVSSCASTWKPFDCNKAPEVCL